MNNYSILYQRYNGAIFFADKKLLALNVFLPWENPQNSLIHHS